MPYEIEARYFSGKLQYHGFLLWGCAARITLERKAERLVPNDSMTSVI
ncbi:hypothetical protein X769_33255 [Mesorhizobium sp. LSJC268A00]|nr:hypothetical protein X769_33255 [Mesorhizobium sp. LSJC268A00]